MIFIIKKIINMISKEKEKYYIDLIKESFSLREVCLKANIKDTTGN